MLVESFKRALAGAQRKKWDKIYIAIDIHDTIVYGNYNANELPTEFIGNSKTILQEWSKRDDIVLLIYTCSHPVEIAKYMEFFKSNDIIFKYANRNPDVNNNELGCYDSKMYFNVLLEDKAGFNAEEECDIINEFVKNNNFNYAA